MKHLIPTLLLLLLCAACQSPKSPRPARLTDDALMDTVLHRTFLYFWQGAEPVSGLAPSASTQTASTPKTTAT